MAKQLVLVLDAGTTNTKAALLDANLRLVWHAAVANGRQQPHPGWVEQYPMALWQTALGLLRQAQIAAPAPIVALGIANQRETTLLWDRHTGQPLYPAIVWEDKRTEVYCRQLAQNAKTAAYVRQATGLLISPYFSAPKLHWLLQRLRLNPAALVNCAFGTVDSWLIYQLSGGHFTDYTNASRSLLYNIKKLTWDRRLLDIFGAPHQLLPVVKKSNDNFGVTKPELFKQPIPIRAVMGDQQASLYAAGTVPGTLKVTYGTGIFPMKLIGPKFELKDGYATTLAVGRGGQPVFAWEAKVENAAARTTPLLNQPQKLEAVVKQLAGQTNTLLRPLLDKPGATVVVDGGISQNNVLVEQQARLSGVKIQRQLHHDGTILGVAKLIFDTL